MRGRLIGLVGLAAVACVVLAALFQGYVNPTMTLALDRLVFCF